jgi:IclR family transcriptional regulator, KDG regulon repressor
MAANKESRETDPFSVRALVRGLSILGLFDVDHREWTIDEMAEQTGLLRMTAYRMVRTLESMAFLVRDPSTNRYRLGPATFTMNYVATDHSSLVESAQPFLERLVVTTGESVTMAVEIDGFPVCVDIINTSRPFKRRTAPGRILGDLVSVHGKLFAAFKPLEERERLLSQTVPQHTPYTVVDRDALRAELDQIARDDVAFDIEGVYLGTCAVGAPVRDQVGGVAATISVVVPTGRFGPAERDLCTQAVKSAAASFSAYLGWNPGKPG